MSINFAPGPIGNNQALLAALLASKGGAAETSSDLEREIAKMRVLGGLKESGNDAPVQHWTQGISRLTNALVTKRLMDQMISGDKAEKASGNKMIIDVLGGAQQGNTVPQDAPAAQPSPSPSPAPGPMSAIGDGIGSLLGALTGGGGAAPAPTAMRNTPEMNGIVKMPEQPQADTAALGGGMQNLVKAMMNPTPAAEQPSVMTGGNPSQGIDRSRIAQELQQNPALVKRYADMINGETNFRDPKLATIQAESVANRALARGIPMDQALLSVGDDPKRGYYARDTYSRPAGPEAMTTFQNDILPKVLGGSDVGSETLGFAPTGNASQLGFAGRRAAQGMYDAHKWYSGVPGKGEMYAIEGGDKARMAKNLKSGFPAELLSPQTDVSNPELGAPVQVASLDPSAGMPQEAAQPGMGTFAPGDLPNVPTAAVRPTGVQVAQAQTGQAQPKTPMPKAGQLNVETLGKMLNNKYAAPIAQALIKQGLSPDTKTADLGNEVGVIDARGNVIARIPKKQDTNDIREYGLYSEQEKATGRQPMPFMDYQTKIKQAGSSKVSIDQRAETKYDEFNSKSFAELNHEIPKAASQARSKIATLDRLGQILADPNIATGAGAGLILDAKRYAKTIGIDVGDLSGPEAVRAIQNQFALELRNPSGGAGMPGAMSDKDREFLQSIPPGLERTPEGNKVIGGYLKKVANRSLEIERLRQGYVKKHGRLNDGFYQELADFSDANPLFPEGAAPGNAPSAPTASPAGTPSIDDLLKKYGK